MSRYADDLQAIAHRLDLPQPARSRVLLELAADMDDLDQHLRRQGLPDHEVRRRVLERFDLSDDALGELALVHRGPARRLLDRLPARSLRLWERVLLVVMALAALRTGGWFTRSSRVMHDAGAQVWAVLAVALVVFLLAAGKAYQLFIRQDHRVRRLRNGLAPVLGLSVGMMALGFVLPWLQVLLRLGRPTDQHPVAMMMDWTLSTTAMLQASLGLGLLGALAWFGLAQAVLRIERHESDVLLCLPHDRPEETPCP
jgi:hypothetical protein